MNVQPIKPYNSNSHSHQNFGAKPVGMAKHILTDALAQVYRENPLKKWLSPESAEALTSTEKAFESIAKFGSGLKIKIDAYKDSTWESTKFFIASINGRQPKSQIADNVFSKIPKNTSALETIKKVAYDLNRSDLSVELLKKTPEQEAIKYINRTFSGNA